MDPDGPGFGGWTTFFSRPPSPNTSTIASAVGEDEVLGTAADKQTVLSRVAGVRLEHQFLIANEGWDENADLRGESPWHSTSEQTANQIAKDLPLLLSILDENKPFIMTADLEKGCRSGIQVLSTNGIIYALN